MSARDLTDDELAQLEQAIAAAREKEK